MTREEPKIGRSTKQKQNFGRPDPTALKIFTGPIFQLLHEFFNSLLCLWNMYALPRLSKVG
jgi:hypothetical protein